MGISMLLAARNDFADGNRRDGRFLIALGILSLASGGVLALVPA